MSDCIGLSELNHCSRERFVENLAAIFEHSPWVAQQVVEQRPFESVDSLHQAMFNAVKQSSQQARLTLIREHPELAGQAAEAGQLTAESTREQQGAGLNQCSAEELQRLRDMNRAYLQRFGFPFVIAVSGLNRHDILQQMQLRLHNEADQELVASIEQIGKIARIRLHQLIKRD